MIELKIDEELRDLLPSLSLDEKKQLEKNLIQDGYIESPIYTWNGYIIDGHNRYEICRKNRIEFPVEELQLGKDSTKTDAMEWMINTQLGRRNLESYQKIIVAERYERILKEKAKRNQGCNNVADSVHVDKELAKIAGVGHATIGRWKYVMNNDKNGDIKRLMRNGDIKISKAYNDLKSINKRKSIPSVTKKSLSARSGGKCEICGWGNEYMAGVLVSHHIVEHYKTQDDSLDNLIMICPNCHNIIHTVKDCSDSSIKNGILGSLDKNTYNKIIKLANVEDKYE